MKLDDDITADRSGQPLAFVFGMAPWRTFLPVWLPERRIVQRDRSRFTALEFQTRWAPLLRRSEGAQVYVWGYKHPPFLQQFCEKNHIPLIRVEDGFLRSVNLGSTNVPPLSLCFDSPVLYYDSTGRSQLEHILENHDFARDATLRQRAERGLQRLLATRLSKYNNATDVTIEAVYGPKDRTRVLVLGQVDDDMSILKGCDRPVGNNDLIDAAVSDNPGAQIIFKPHPDIMHGHRPSNFSRERLAANVQVLETNITLADAFQTVDRVYTVTSLAGFEALMRGIPVTCLGMPFYAGWGATDDRQSCPRRTARRDVTDIFAAAYILYSRYYDPQAMRGIEFEDAVETLHQMRLQAAS
ncbi:capsular polysaccharide export protein [Pararhizobium capsulatum DSM 1112]|uniref:Capsular polysaccharide export protein n=1 Tax=Pararhizobium capsulatum DSM 1112 TaxID=1121113 RepID=A0ABU0BNR8_9HYPH|nr:capsular polysaccharide biosynthesis protein [Pararhizobium capsulatum]MDQ0319894.1 capsular polysaccharide export protein [Pararhizobium capsulatum DSM 1112]